VDVPTNFLAVIEKRNTVWLEAPTIIIITTSSNYLELGFREPAPLFFLYASNFKK